MNTRPLKVAIVHYWFNSWRGGEKVVADIAEMFPSADIYTHVYSPDVINASPLRGRRIKTTFIHHLPFAQKLYQRYLPLMPIALEQLDLGDYDLVISSESGPAKGVVVPPHVAHVCYTHTPMRYLWDMYHEYLGYAGWFTRALMRPFIHYLRMWDRLSADRVDHFIANSQYVAQRIEKFYRRPAMVLSPAVDLNEFPVAEEGEDFYLMVGALVRYKKADLAVRAFNRLGLPLIIIGDGELYDEIKAIAGPRIKVLGRRSRAEILDHYRRCRALVFPGVEDFGIVPLEAMATGKPVIAYAKGGALETVLDGITGIHFMEQTEAALMEAVGKLESGLTRFSPKAIRAHAAQFDLPQFRERLLAFIKEKYPHLPL